MTIASTDIKFRLSVGTGPGNSTAQANPNNSLGKFLSSTAIVDATLDNLFDDISTAENAASDVEYRCLFVLNDHATATWESVVVWISAEVSGGAAAAIALDGVGVTTKTSVSNQADVVANESTAPSGETFTAPTTKATGLSVGDVGPGQCFAVWVRRTANNTGTVSNDGVTIRAEGITTAV